MNRFILIGLTVFVACADPLAPSGDCRPEMARVRILRGRPDSTVLDSNQVGNHPVGYYERWFYYNSPYVETFAWGALLPHCIYDQENRPDWLLPSPGP